MLTLLSICLCPSAQTRPFSLPPPAGAESLKRFLEHGPLSPAELGRWGPQGWREQGSSLETLQARPHRPHIVSGLCLSTQTASRIVSAWLFPNGLQSSLGPQGGGARRAGEGGRSGTEASAAADSVAINSSTPGLHGKFI